MQHSRGELTNALSIRHLWDSSGTLDDAIDPTAHDLLAVDFARPTAGHHSRGRKRDLRRDVTFRRLYARRPSRPQAAACPCLSPHAPTAMRLRLAPSVAGSPSGCPDARNSAGDCRLAREAHLSTVVDRTLVHILSTVTESNRARVLVPSPLTVLMGSPGTTEERVKKLRRIATLLSQGPRGQPSGPETTPLNAETSDVPAE